MSDVSPLSGISGLSFDSTLLSPLLFFCLVLVPFLLYLFSGYWSFLLNFFQKILQYFSLTDRLFLYDSCLAARRSKFVSGVCSMLPYGTGICCYAYIYFFLLLLSIPFLYFFKNLVLINRRNSPPVSYTHLTLPTTVPV